jgi:flagellar motility protein MotE (MotC chaperone)
MGEVMKIKEIKKVNDHLKALQATISAQNAHIELLTTQLLNEKLKNKNLERLVTTRNKKTIKD